MLGLVHFSRILAKSEITHTTLFSFFLSLASCSLLSSQTFTFSFIYFGSFNAANKCYLFFCPSLCVKRAWTMWCLIHSFFLKKNNNNNKIWVNFFFPFQLDNYFLSFIFKGNIFSVRPFESSTILCICYIVKQYV